MTKTPKLTDLCLRLEDITKAYEQADINSKELKQELLNCNPFKPGKRHNEFKKWAKQTYELIKAPITIHKDSPSNQETIQIKEVSVEDIKEYINETLRPLKNKSTREAELVEATYNEILSFITK
jgi:hypothetical protein